MERLKPFKNHQYQHLQNLEIESHDHNVDECHEKEFLNIQSRLEVAIVDGDYKPTIHSHLDLKNEKNKIVKYIIPSSKKPFLLQGGDEKINVVQAIKRSSVEELNEPQKNEAPYMQETRYNFFEESDLNSWNKIAKIERETKFDKSHEKVQHSIQEISYGFFGENLDSWKKNAEVEKESNQKGKYVQFDIPDAIIPPKLIENAPQSHNETLDETYQGSDFGKNVDNAYDSYLESPYFEERAMKCAPEYDHGKTKNFQADKPLCVTPDTTKIEGGNSKNIYANESQNSTSFLSNLKIHETTERENVEFDGNKCVSNGEVKAHSNMKKHNVYDTEQTHEESTSSQPNSSGQVGSAMQIPTNRKGCTTIWNENIEDDTEEPFQDVHMAENIMINKWAWTVYCDWLAVIILVSGLMYIMIDRQLRELQLWSIQLWRWMIFTFVTVCGRRISNWLIRIIVYLIERKFLLKLKVLYFVYALKGDVRNCLWLTFVLLTWNILFNVDVQDGKNILIYVSKVLQCFLIAAVLVVIKTFLVKILASSFHMDNYFKRIQDCIFNQYVLETLSSPPKHEIQVGRHNNLVNLHHENNDASHPANNIKSTSNKPNNSKRSNILKEDNGVVIDVNRFFKTDKKNASPWSMNRLINLVKNYEITTLMENFDKDVLSDNDSIIETGIINEYKAKIAAKQIFKNVVKPGCKFITEKDLMHFLNKEQVSQAILLFDGAMESRKIFPKSLENYVINVYKEKRALISSLNDTKTAVNKLHGIINIFLSILVIILWLLILGIATTKFIVFILSQLLVVVFIFGNTCRNIFEAIIFLFVVHPFDIGDRCVIDGQQLIVEEMNILTTVFFGELNAKIWYPNSVLATKPIQNFYRSPEMSESFEFFVHSSTSAEKIAHLKDMIGKYIASKHEHWKSSFSMLIIDLDNSGKMKLSLNLTHTMSYQNFEEKVSRRSDLLWEMKKYLEALSIEYHLPAFKVHIQNLDMISNAIHS